MLNTPEFELQNYLERLCNLMRGHTRGALVTLGLQPVQLEALSYLARCNRFSNTPAAVAEYLGSTKGTVSQTLKVLESKGLLEKVTDTKDRRVVHLVPTPQGREILAGALPAPILGQAVAGLAPPDLHALVDGLRRLLGAIQRANERRGFGACATCRYNARTPEGIYCRLTGEALAKSDLGLICREHGDPPTRSTPARGPRPPPEAPSD